MMAVDTNLTRTVGPAPRARVATTEAGQAIEPVLDERQNLDDFHDGFVGAFGTTEQIIAEVLFQQVLNAIHPDPAKPLDAGTANFVLALLHRIGPRDELEALLVCQLIATHSAAMDVARRAVHTEQSAGGRAVYLNLARRLMTTFTLQMDSLGRHRGKPTVQKVIVEKVLVAPGAQAIVGAIAIGGRGDGG
jgi:hypothetical protein